MFGVNGAEIVFNPSATVGALRYILAIHQYYASDYKTNYFMLTKCIVCSVHNRPSIGYQSPGSELKFELCAIF
jgi:hypothetical protein